jgi:hypothetical protein
MSSNVFPVHVDAELTAPSSLDTVIGDNLETQPVAGSFTVDLPGSSIAGSAVEFQTLVTGENGQRIVTPQQAVGQTLSTVDVGSALAVESTNPPMADHLSPESFISGEPGIPHGLAKPYLSEESLVVGMQRALQRKTQTGVDGAYETGRQVFDQDNSHLAPAVVKLPEIPNQSNPGLSSLDSNSPAAMTDPEIFYPRNWTYAEYVAHSGKIQKFSAFPDSKGGFWEQPVSHEVFLLSQVPTSVRIIARKVWKESQNRKFINRSVRNFNQLEQDLQRALKSHDPEDLYIKSRNLEDQILQYREAMELMGNFRAVEVSAFQIVLRSGVVRTFRYTDSSLIEGGAPFKKLIDYFSQHADEIVEVRHFHNHAVKGMPIWMGDSHFADFWIKRLRIRGPFQMYVVTSSVDNQLVLFHEAWIPKAAPKQ